MLEGLERIERECGKMGIVCGWASHLLETHIDWKTDEVMSFDDIAYEALNAIREEARALSEMIERRERERR